MDHSDSYRLAIYQAISDKSIGTSIQDLKINLRSFQFLSNVYLLQLEPCKRIENA